MDMREHHRLQWFYGGRGGEHLALDIILLSLSLFYRLVLTKMWRRPMESRKGLCLSEGEQCCFTVVWCETIIPSHSGWYVLLQILMCLLPFMILLWSLVHSRCRTVKKQHMVLNSYMPSLTGMQTENIIINYKLYALGIIQSLWSGLNACLVRGIWQPGQGLICGMLRLKGIYICHMKNKRKWISKIWSILFY